MFPSAPVPFRRMDRYILAELAVPFGLTLGVFLLILTMQQGLRLMEWIVARGVGTEAVAKLLLYLLPLMLVLALPVATLIASASAFNRLAGDRELLALWALGVSPWRLLRPVVLFAGGVALAASVLLNVGEPISGESLREFAVNLLGQEHAAIVIEEGRFQPLEGGLILYVKAAPRPAEFDGVFVFDYRNPDDPQFAVANRGVIEVNRVTQRLELTLQQGSLHRKPEPGGPYQRIFFDRYLRRIDLSNLIRTPLAEQRDIAAIKYQLRTGGPVQPAELGRLATYEGYHALPAACLLLAVLGLPLGLVSSRGGRFGGFAAGLAALLAYYLLMTAADAVAQTRMLPPLAAAWLPNGVLLVLTAGLLARSFAPRSRA
ncbi:MAG: LptF/LptG family permease [Nitrospirota bacterium]